MLERVAELVNADPAIVRWGRHMNESFMVEVSDEQYLVTVREGRVESVVKGPFVMRSWRFAIRASPTRCTAWTRAPTRTSASTSAR
jgi:hypothetical protein